MNIGVHRAGLVSLCLTLCLCGTYLVTPPSARADSAAAHLADLSVSGRVLINGSEAVSGAAVFPGSKFVTEKGSVAEIMMGRMGRLKALAESAGTVDFGEAGVSGSLEAGIIHVSKPRGVAATFTTKDGSVVAGKEEAALFVVNLTGGNTLVRAKQGRVELRAGNVTKVLTKGQDAAAGTQQTTPQDDDDDDDYGGWFWLGAVGFTAIVTAAIIIAVTDDDEGGNVPPGPIIIPPNPSPAR